MTFTSTGDHLQKGRFFSNETVWSSEASGWSSAHLRRYSHESVVDEVETPPSLDQVLVLVTRGHTLIESFKAGRWRSDAHMPGNVGLTCPGESTKLRWHGSETHDTLHLHLPALTMAEAIADIGETEPGSLLGSRQLSTKDTLVENVMSSLARAAERGAPDLFASSACIFLARYLIVGRPDGAQKVPDGSESARMRRIEDYMFAHLSTDILLEDLAAIAGCSTFQLIRACKGHWGQTPFARLTEMRIDAGRHLLMTTSNSVISIALDCGYSNPSHFATAFRRIVGMSPSEYRRI